MMKIINFQHAKNLGFLSMRKDTWFQKLGFYTNPFTIKPSAFHDELEGNGSIIKEINKKISESSMVFVCGEYGAGKTSMLKKIINEFGGKRQVIYYNCNQKTTSIDFDKLLINAGGFFSRLFRIRKRNMILLLDESSDMNKKDISRLKNYYQEGFFRSVVFVSKVEDIKLIREIDELVGKNKYMARALDKDDAVKLIRKRIGDLKFISDDKIAKIFSKNRNPRAFLMNCEDVCRFAFERGASKVADEHIEAILG